MCDPTRPTERNADGAIQALPQLVIDKIAAGEVVERPASVVKELVENSLDARATRIDVTLEEGGCELIRVVDDGHGMGPGDVARAFLPHATSKLRDAEDLFNVSTMGFRGEALASIASVSQARLVSRPEGALEGAEIRVEGGEMGTVRAVAAPEGTTLEVRHLFYNTPVRRKFLKTKATEFRHVSEAVTRQALAHPEVAFRLTHGRRTSLRLPAVDDAQTRIRAVFGGEIADALLGVDEQTPAMSVTGFVGPPALAQRSTNMQYVFLNGRHIRDRAMTRAVMEAYRGRMVSRTFAVVVLYLWMDPSRVDVNVHPTKIEVRFRDPGAVYALTLTALERALADTAPVAGAAPAESGPVGREAGVRKAMQDFFSGPRSAPRSTPPPSPGLAPAAPAVAPGREAPPRNVTQIGETYIVEETADGFRLIDQHALHERLLYRELARRSREASVARQRLLIPEVVELKPADFQLALELRPALERLGLEIEEFGPSAVAVHAVPHMMRAISPSDLLRETIDELRQEAEGDARITREERLLRSLACKGAVKSGKRLNRAEIEALLDQRDRADLPPTCPHGRPHTLTFRLDELDRQFRRR